MNEKQADEREKALGDRVGFWTGMAGTGGVAAYQQPKVQQWLRLAVKRANLGEDFEAGNPAHQAWLRQQVSRQKQASLQAWQKLPAWRQAQTAQQVKAAMENWDALLSYGEFLAKTAATVPQQFLQPLDPIGQYQVADLRDRLQQRVALGLGAGFAGGSMLAAGTMPYKGVTVPVMGLLGGAVGGMAGAASLPIRSELMRIHVENKMRNRRALPRP